MRCKNDFDCLGTVRIVTDDLLVFQGQIRKNDDRKTEYIQPKIEVENENEFILLELDCDVALIRDNGNIENTNPPLFEEGDLVRINVANIITIGPADACFEKGKDKGAV